MFRVIFFDSVHGTITEDFEDFNEAVGYWDSYADTPSCFAGKMIDLTENEIIWAF